MGYLFENRVEAGKKLAKKIESMQFKNPVLLALPRGGAVLADEVAKRLDIPFDVVIARKIGAPDQPEFGIGALSEDEEPIFNSMVSSYFIPKSSMVKDIVSNEKAELKRRIQLYRNGHHLPEMSGKEVIVIDDGIATGVTAVAAAHFLHKLNPEKLVLAVPLGPIDISEEIIESYDEIICLHYLENMSSVGAWYHQFDQVEDDEVLDLLKKYH